jgi:hypothetical protein
MSLTPASTLITFKDFKGQINKISHEEVKPNFASKCLNVLPLIKGVACKRNGFNVLTTQNAGSRITNLFTFERTIITEELIATLTALYKRNGVNLIAIKSDFTSSQKYCIINYNDNAIVLNGINYPQKSVSLPTFSVDNSLLNYKDLLYITKTYPQRFNFTIKKPT